jgi:hypothetical protein
MNRRRIAAIAFVLFSVAAVYSKTHEQQTNNPYNQLQSPFAQAGDTARPSPNRVSYLPEQPSQADPYAAGPEGSDAAGTGTYSPVSYEAGAPRSDGYGEGNSGSDNSGTGNARPAAGSTAPDVASWTRQTGGDRSAAVALPANWRIAQIASGTTAVEGPNREQVVLGLQTFVSPGSRNYAPYMGPEQAIQWYTRSQGVQLLRVLDRAPGTRNNGGQSELMLVETQTQDGTRYKALALVLTNPMQMNIWKFYVSYIAAPEQQFDAEAGTMKAIWNSWKLDPGYVQGSLDHAQKTVQDTATWMNDHIRHNQNVNANTNAGIDNALRGVTVMENTGTGVRGETQIGTEQQVLRDCERRGISCRKVPDDQLVQPQ